MNIIELTCPTMLMIKRKSLIEFIKNIKEHQRIHKNIASLVNEYHIAHKSIKTNDKNKEHNRIQKNNKSNEEHNRTHQNDTCCDLK